MFMKSSQKDKPIVAVLEGEYIDDDFISVLHDLGFETEIFERLYYRPDKLDELPELDPDYLYIRTTGLDMGGRKHYRKTLIKKFTELNWLPTAVIFFNDQSAETYLNICRKLKKKGVRFFLLPYSADLGLQEIEWI